MRDEPVAIEEREHALVASIARPERRNAIGRDVMDGLSAAVDYAAAQHGKPFVVIGSGGWFSSGGDIQEFGGYSGRDAADMAEQMAGVLRAIEGLPVPTVAALDGPAIGGGAEMCLAFDLRVAVADIYIAFPEAQLGVTTGWQGAERLARLVGYSAALHLLLTGRRVAMGEALVLGLVNEVWERDEFEGRLDPFLASLARAGEAGREIKQLMRGTRSATSDGREERVAFERLWDSPVRAEAMRRALRR